MNKFLSSMLNFFNIVLAVVLFFFGGIFLATTFNIGIFGFLLSLVLSVISCGSIALLIEIKDELVTANEHLKNLSEKK